MLFYLTMYLLQLVAFYEINPVKLSPTYRSRTTIPKKAETNNKENLSLKNYPEHWDTSLKLLINGFVLCYECAEVWY